MTSPFLGKPLTDGERALLESIAEGMSNAEIAAERWVTVETVKWHANRVFAKLGARNRTHAVVLAYHRGLLVVPERR